MPEFKTKKELLQYAELAETLTFGDIDTSDKLDNNRQKGGLGEFIEESYFGYEVNTRQEPDFAHLEVELKVTPVRELKSGLLSAKERLVLNIINYEEEYKKSFQESSFWTKNAQLLLMFYLWRKEWKRSQYPILKSILHIYSEKDLLIIKQDWQKIIQKIKDGKAHELSEGDTNYLGAVTKGSSSKTKRNQPFNDKRAKQRAFSLKQSYMTALVRNQITKEDVKRATNERVNKKRIAEYKSVVKSEDILKSVTFDDYILNLFTPYQAKKRKDLVKLFDLKNKDGQRPKHVNFLIVQKILGVSGTTQEIHAQEFEKANIIVKTIELNNGKTPIEHLKIDEISSFEEITAVDWEESSLYEKLESTKYLFVIFDKQTDESVLLRDAVFWSMPSSDLNGLVQSTWLVEKEKLNSGIVLTYQENKSKKGYTVSNNLVKPSDNKIIHSRPSAAVSQYCAPYRNDKNKLMNNARRLPTKVKWINRPYDKKEELQDEWMTKQAFWLNNSYIFDQINKSK